MAGSSKQQELVLKITAQADQAKKDVAALDKSAKALEDGVDVPVKLTGADKAAQQLDAAATAGKRLGVTVNSIDAGHVRDLDGPARIAAAAMGEIETAAERADRALEDIDGPDLEAPLGKTKDQLATTSQAADGTRNAFANLVGNTAQDVGELGGVMGSLGVAVGQVAEYTADATSKGGGLTAALSGAASMAGPMVALAAAGLAVQKVMGDISKRSEEAKAANDAYLKSLVEGSGVLDDYADSQDEAFGEGTTDQIQDFNKFMRDTLSATGDLDKTAVALGEIGLTMDDLGSAVGGADAGFREWATTLLKSKGFTDEAADRLARMVSQEENLDDILGRLQLKGGQGMGDLVTPEQAAQLENYARGLEQINDVVEKLDTEEGARKFNDLARAIPGMSAAVDEARAASVNERDAALLVNDALQHQKTERDANARAAEEGAQAVSDAGSIIDQVNRQVADSEKLAADAADDAKEAQDRWLLGTVDYPAAVDNLTESILDLAEQTVEQTKKGDEGAASMDGHSKAALANRDAMREVYTAAKDVIDKYAEQGATSAEVAALTLQQADAAYQLAVDNGLSEEAAAKLRDTILTVPTARTTEMEYQEKNYGDMLDHRDTLQEDIDATVFFHGVLDRSVVNAVNDIRAAGGIPGGQSVAPAGVAVVPSAGLQTVAVPVAAPVASPTSQATSRAVTVTQPVTINVNAGVVADTFALQRVVRRAASAGVRLAGSRL